MLILSELLDISNQEFINRARNTFLALDTTGIGLVTQSDFHKAFTSIDTSVTESDADRIYRQIVQTEDKISYSLWLSALVHCSQLSLKNLTSLFKFLDVEKKGRITVVELEKAYRPHIFRLKL